MLCMVRGLLGAMTPIHGVVHPYGWRVFVELVFLVVFHWTCCRVVLSTTTIQSL